MDSVDELLSKVDAVLLETNDGRLHLEQFHACARAGKPVFIDKPVAARLEDVLAIYDIATHYKVPMFSSSSLRYSGGVQAIRKGAIGSVLGCDAYSPCSLEKTHSDLFWYGIHGVEILYTAMGRGCESVTRASTPAMDVVTGTWAAGRIGTFRGIRKGKTGYGGTAFGEKAIQSVGGYEGYRPLVLEIAEFFQTGKAPVDPLETIELYSFMAAAEVSSREGGRPVKIAEVMSASRKLADARLQQFGINPPARVAD